jgi:hypothetical protein
MRTVFSVLAAALLLAAPAAARAADPVAMVNGGGRADFVATPHSLTTSGFTNFSAGLTVYDDGTASGHFVCEIPGIVIVSGDVLEGSVNDDGSVTVSGLAHGYFHPDAMLFTDLPFAVTFRAGGPGVGGFDYVDGSFPPDLYDTELVSRGKIKIVYAE